MAHRTQITLEDDQYQRLLAESAATGLSLAELIRRAVDKEFGRAPARQRQAALDISFGAATATFELDGEAHVDRMRRGLGHRLSRA